METRYPLVNPIQSNPKGVILIVSNKENELLRRVGSRERQLAETFLLILRIVWSRDGRQLGEGEHIGLPWRKVQQSPSHHFQLKESNARSHSYLCLTCNTNSNKDFAYTPFVVLDCL